MRLAEKVLERYLGWMAQAVLRRHHPLVIGITGNVGKTSAREAIYAVLSSKVTVWRGLPDKNYNNQIGVPLVILNAIHHGKNPIGWLGVAFRFLQLYWGKQYPPVVLLEMGIDRPGDMDYLLQMARPQIGILTGIGKIPVHVEFFANPDAVLAEKLKLAQSVPQDGSVILNADDERLENISAIRAQKIFTYGFSSTAKIRVEEFQIHIGESGSANPVSTGALRPIDGGITSPSAISTDDRSRWRSNGVKIPDGIVFKIAYGGSLIPVKILDALGKAQALAAASAFAVGISYGMNPVEIVAALVNYHTPPGRLRVFNGVRGSVILDDTYNAAPAAMEQALETLRLVPGKRKIGVLGDMLELGSYSEEAHRRIGSLIPGACDILMTVGSRAVLIRDQALKGGFNPANTYHFSNSREVAKTLLLLLSEGDLVLAKGGQSMRMERVVESIMAEPEKAKELLVRQSVDWKRKP